MYTRNPYPNSAYYQVYARMSYGNGPNGGSETLQLVTTGAGTANVYDHQSRVLCLECCDARLDA